MYGINPKQFKDRILQPALMRIGLAESNRISLVLGTCLHESRLTYVVQLPNGPALGFGQMEPATHRDLWDSYLRYQPELAEKVRRLAGEHGSGTPPAGEMIGNANYAVAMIAVHYRRVSAPLPLNEPLQLATYWKTYYNTSLGKGTVEQALPHFVEALAA